MARSGATSARQTTWHSMSSGFEEGRTTWLTTTATAPYGAELRRGSHGDEREPAQTNRTSALAHDELHSPARVHPRA